MSKEAYYFSHDANARQDEKILMMLSEHGWEGYGIYWALVEMMFESGETVLTHSKVKGISFSYNIDITLLQSVINTCIEEQLFISDGERFWSESLKKRKSKYHELKTKKSDAGKKGMAKRWSNQDSDNTVITDDNTSYNTVITKDNKGKEKKGKESKKDIIPFDEIINYLNEKAATSYRSSSKKTQQQINARFEDGFTLDDFKVVMDKKIPEWLNEQSMSKYIRPETLFGTKFESYLNQKVISGDGLKLRMSTLTPKPKNEPWSQEEYLRSE